MYKKKEVHALGLCSGGLDSILSALILKDQGIKVSWIAFETPFFSSDKAKETAKDNKIPLCVENITSKYLEMITNPKCKFGKHMNPCTDCHTLMFKLAGNVMVKNNFDFMFSGEVLGQRPMSQNKSSLRYVEKNSGFMGYILRPLSAKNLAVTIPEKKGLVNRDLLMEIKGRSRKQQMFLACKFGLQKYPSPGGGCLLTDKSYANRLRDLFDHQTSFLEKDLQLLKFGRHMRINNKIKIIIGRNLNENTILENYADLQDDILIKSSKLPGPTVIIPKGRKEGLINVNSLNFIASICAGYSKAKSNTELNDHLIDISVNSGNHTDYIKTNVFPRDKSRKFLIL